METLYHLIAADEWLHSADPYAPASLISEGFIHCSTAAQLAGTFARFFAGREDLLLLTIDVAVLPEPPRYEESEPGMLFPHLYAALPHAAVMLVERIRLTADGNLIHSAL